jgi:hypothetical protein
LLRWWDMSWVFVSHGRRWECGLLCEYSVEIDNIEMVWFVPIKCTRQQNRIFSGLIATIEWSIILSPPHCISTSDPDADFLELWSIRSMCMDTRWIWNLVWVHSVQRCETSEPDSAFKKLRGGERGYPDQWKAKLDDRAHVTVNRYDIVRSR